MYMCTIVHIQIANLCDVLCVNLFQSVTKSLAKPRPVPSGIRYTFRVRLPGLAGRPEARIDSAAYFLAECVAWGV